MIALRQTCIALLLGFISISSFAQNPEQIRAESKAAFEAAQAVMKAGPTEVLLGSQAQMKLPQGYVYVPVAESQRLLRSMGNSPGSGLLGMVFPTSNAPWFVVLNFQDAGYVKDDDAREWNADELLTNLKEGTEAGNEDRQRRGIPAIEVAGWVEPPKYDAQTHRLVWSASVRSKGDSAVAEQSVNYNTYALGRDGYVSLNLVTDLATVERDKSAAHELLGALNYNDGKRYTDFNSSTDKVAEYGLAALIGGIAAKKLGLLAVIAAFLLKFWKIGLLAVAGLGAILPKFFKRKKDTGGSPPA